MDAVKSVRHLHANCKPDLMTKRNSSGMLDVIDAANPRRCINDVFPGFKA
jgi:hypothetical protein